jgi:dTDP-4-dehydrorhamnose reductase
MGARGSCLDPPHVQRYVRRVAKSLCLLGGTGFLGTHVVRAAEAAGWHPVVLARRPSAASGAPHAIDARGLESLERELAGSAPSAVVNCAALARIADCARDPELARDVNARLPADLARMAVDHGFRLVHVSTDLVFGAPSAPKRGFREVDSPAPTSVYGATKLDGERGVLAVDPAALVVRLPILCGDSFGRGLGASDSVLAAVARGERPRLFTDEWRTPLDVADAARAIVELVDADIAGILHVAGPVRMTRYDLGLRALRAVGRAGAEALVEPAERAGEHASRPADVALDASRARARLRSPLPEPFARFAGSRAR